MNISKDIYTEFPTFHESFHESGFHLRQILPYDDAEAYYNYMNDQHIKPFIADCELPKSIGEAMKELTYWTNLFKNRHSFYWGICLSDNDTLIGTIGYNQYSTHHKKIELSYDLAHDYWGKGIMSQALHQVVKFAFENLNVVRAQASVAINNKRSVKLLENQGFTMEGLLKKYAVLENTPVDYYMYAKIK